MTKGKTCLVFLLSGVTATGAALAPNQIPAEPGTEKRSSFVQVKAGDTPEPQKPVSPALGRLDRYGDPLPPGAVARLGTVRFRTPDEAEALALAPDGKTIAVSSRGGLFLFATDGGKRIKRLADYMFAGRWQSTLAFSPDGKRLAAWGPAFVDDGKGNRRTKSVVRVWEWAGQQKPREYDAERVIWLGWFSNSEPLAVCLEKDGVRLRELASGRSRRFECQNLRRAFELSERIGWPCALAGKTLALPDEQGTIHVWDTATGAERCTIAPNKGGTHRGLALSPDGRHLATLHLPLDGNTPYQHAVHIWDAMTGRALRIVAADHKDMSTLAFAPNGKTLATAGGNGIRCWDVATGKERSRSEGEGSNTEKLAFSADGQMLATLQRHSSAFHLWDAATGKRKASPAGHTSWPHGTSFSPDGLRLASGGGLDGAIHIWDLADSKSLLTIHRDKWVRGVEFSRDGRSLFSTWTDDNLWISDAATGERQHVIKVEDPERPDRYQNGMSMHLSADGKTLVALSYYHPNQDVRYNETLITGWDPATRKQLFRRRLPRWEVLGTDWWNAVSADARMLALTYPSSGLGDPGGGPMRLEDLATGQLLLDFPDVEGQTWPLAFSPDGRLLASSNYNYKRRKEGDPASTGRSVLLWEVATAAQVLSLPLAGQSRVAFSPNGQFLAMTAPTRDILICDLFQGGELRRFKGLDSEVTWLAFAPDGRRLVSGLADSTLLIWDVGAPAAPRTGKLAAEAVAKAWDDLAGSDAARAFQARWAFVRAPDTALAHIQKHLKPARPADPKRLQKLVADLDSQQFPVRSAATKELEDLGQLAAGALRQVLTKNSSVELGRRVETLLSKLRGPVTRGELLRALRAAAILEDIASPEARKMLEGLAQGTPEARLTQEARGALQRLGKP
jgi:WD40 repeat protein